MIFQVKHFKPQEFQCKCCGQGGAVISLVLVLEILRRAWGSPIVVTSGYRCKKHNHEVHGAVNSRHMLGVAADIKPVNGNIDDFKKLVRMMYGDTPEWEIIYTYSTFVHLAVPRDEPHDIWRGQNIAITPSVKA